MEILNIKDLTFQYPESQKNALSNITLNIKEGDFLLLCGASGSGKTTLLRLLKEEIAPYGAKMGSIDFKNNATVAIVTQDADNQIVSDTVWRNLAFGLESLNKPSDEIKRKIAEIAEFFDITHMFRKNTFELSGGEKQLLNLASVMVLDPDILVLDEPTSQLDPIAARNFIDAVKRLNEEMNLTVIISEHRCEDLWNYANKICVLDDGRLIYSGLGDNFSELNFNEYIDLPQGIQLYKKLNISGKYPTTVSDCRKFLLNNFKKDIDKIEEIVKTNHVALEIKDIYFRYQKHSPDVLKNLSLKCSFGEILTLLGGNGSGKTTLLSLISGVNKPYSGKIKKHGKKIAVLPQNVKTVFTKDILREDFALITDKFQDVCEKLSILHLLDRNPYDLSGGEAQRAALAKVLLLKPDILCLDEPTKGIDAKGKSEIQKILKTLKSEGVAIIIVSHDADFSAEISDKCAFLFDGQIVSEGTPRKIFSTNRFYTTYASRISRHMYKNTVTIDDIVTLCQRNGSY